MALGSTQPPVQYIILGIIYRFDFVYSYMSQKIQTMTFDAQDWFPSFT
jgi:hypothetical protein